MNCANLYHRGQGLWKNWKYFEKQKLILKRALEKLEPNNFFSFYWALLISSPKEKNFNQRITFF